MSDKELKEEIRKQMTKMINLLEVALKSSKVREYQLNLLEGKSSVEEFNQNLLFLLATDLQFNLGVTWLLKILEIEEKQVIDAIQQVMDSDFQDNTPIIRLFRGHR